eukprot:COSAG01_NODE_18501_length_1071_cov_38.978395_1_plen_61_part_10
MLLVPTIWPGKEGAVSASAKRVVGEQPGKISTLCAPPAQRRDGVAPSCICTALVLFRKPAV